MWSWFHTIPAIINCSRLSCFEGVRRCLMLEGDRKQPGMFSFACAQQSLCVYSAVGYGRV